MRELIFRERSILFSEKEWSSLLRRFNVKRAKVSAGEIRLETCCILCDIHARNMPGCGKCPIAVQALSCGKIVDFFIFEAGLDPVWQFRMDTEELSWYNFNDEEARKQLTAVYDALAALPRVNKTRR